MDEISVPPLPMRDPPHIARDGEAPHNGGVHAPDADALRKQRDDADKLASTRTERGREARSTSAARRAGEHRRR